MKIRLFHPTMIVVCTSFLFNSFCHAQKESVSNKNVIQLQGKHYRDSIVLRWGYTDAKLWYKMLKQPVKVYRRNVSQNGKYEAIAEIMPWDSTKIEATAAVSQKNEILVVVLENIYRNWGNSTFSDYGTILEKTDNFNNRWSLVHLVADQFALAAEAAGLRFTDKTINPKFNYAYKVVAGDNQAYKVITSKQASFKPVIYQKEEKESSVVLFWDQKLHDYHYTSYWVESSSDGVNYTRITEVPFVQMTDQKITNNKKYYSFTAPNANYQKKYYRLIGNDAFGDESLPSEAIMAMGRDKTPPPVPSLYADTLMNHLTKNLYWTFDNSTDIAAIHLERSFGDKTETLLNWAKPNQNKKTDEVDLAGIYKYRLIAADTAGNFAYSTPLYTRIHDMVPPSKPTKPVAYADTTGIVTLGWNEHAEKDIIGYNIYAADGNKRSFIKLNAQTHRSRIYQDTIGTSLLNEKRYYFIVAVDDDFMRSPPSDTLVISRPDRIPPSPALIGDYRVLPEGIRLTLLPSSSRDVVRHDLWRKAGTQEWQLIHQLTKIPTSFTDTDVKSGVTYYYKIHAVDDGGLISKAVDVAEIAAMKSQLSKPEISITKNENTILISIADGENNEQHKYMLYKAIDDHSPQLYEILPSNSFTETGKPGIKWRYRVRALSSDGRQGPFSDEIIVQL